MRPAKVGDDGRFAGSDGSDGSDGSEDEGGEAAGAAPCLLGHLVHASRKVGNGEFAALGIQLNVRLPQLLHRRSTLLHLQTHDKHTHTQIHTHKKEEAKVKVNG